MGRSSKWTGLSLVDGIIDLLKRDSNDSFDDLRNKILNSNTNLRAMGVMDDDFFSEYFPEFSGEIKREFLEIAKTHTERYAKELFSSDRNIPISLGTIKILEPLESVKFICRLYSQEIPNINDLHYGDEFLSKDDTQTTPESFYLKHQTDSIWPNLVPSCLKMQGYADLIYEITLEMFSGVSATGAVDIQDDEYDFAEKIVNDFLCSIGVKSDVSVSKDISKIHRNKIELLGKFMVMKDVFESFIPVAISMDISRRTMDGANWKGWDIDLYSKPTPDTHEMTDIDQQHGLKLSVREDDLFIQAATLMDSNIYDGYYDNRFDVDTGNLKLPPLSERIDEITLLNIMTSATENVKPESYGSIAEKITNSLRGSADHINASAKYLSSHKLSMAARNAYMHATKSSLRGSQRGYQFGAPGEGEIDDEYRGDLSKILKAYYTCLFMVDLLNVYINGDGQNKLDKYDQVRHVLSEETMMSGDDDSYFPPVDMEKYGGIGQIAAVYVRLKSFVAANIASTQYFQDGGYTREITKMFSGYSYYDTVRNDTSLHSRSHSLFGKHFSDMAYRRLLNLEGVGNLSCHLDTALYDSNNANDTEAFASDSDILKNTLGFIYYKNYQRTYRSGDIVKSTREINIGKDATRIQGRQITPAVLGASDEEISDMDIANKVRRRKERNKLMDLETMDDDDTDEKEGIDAGSTGSVPISKTTLQADYHKCIYLLNQIIVGNMVYAEEVDPLSSERPISGIKPNILSKISKGIFGNSTVYGFDISSDLFNPAYGLNILTDHAYDDDFAKWFLLLSRNNSVTRKISGGRPLLFLTALLRSMNTADDFNTISNITMKLSLLTEPNMIEKYAADEFVMNVLPDVKLNKPSLSTTSSGISRSDKTRRQILSNVFGDNDRGKLLMGFERDVFGATKSYRNEYKSMINLRMRRLETFIRYSKGILNAHGNSINPSEVRSMYVTGTKCKNLIPTGYLVMTESPSGNITYDPLDFTGKNNGKMDLSVHFFIRKMTDTMRWTLQNLLGEVSEGNTFEVFSKALLGEIIKMTRKGGSALGTVGTVSPTTISFNRNTLEHELISLKKSYGSVIYDFKTIVKEGSKMRDVMSARRIKLMEDQGLRPDYDSLNVLHSAIITQIPYMNTNTNRIVTADGKTKYLGKLDDVRKFNPIYTRTMEDIVLYAIAEQGVDVCETIPGEVKSQITKSGGKVTETKTSDADIYSTLGKIFNVKCNIVMDATVDVLRRMSKDKSFYNMESLISWGLDKVKFKNLHDVKKNVDDHISNLAVSIFRLKRYLISTKINSRLLDSISYIETRLLSARQRSILGNFAYINLASKIKKSSEESVENRWEGYWPKLIDESRVTIEREKSRLEEIYGNIHRELIKIDSILEKKIIRLIRKRLSAEGAKSITNVPDILGKGKKFDEEERKSLLLSISRDYTFRGNFIITNMVQLSQRMSRLREEIINMVNSTTKLMNNHATDSCEKLSTDFSNLYALLNTLIEMNKIYKSIFGLPEMLFSKISNYKCYNELYEKIDIRRPLGRAKSSEMGPEYSKNNDQFVRNVEKSIKSDSKSKTYRYTMNVNTKIAFALLQKFEVSLLAWKRIDPEDPSSKIGLEREYDRITVNLRTIANLWRDRDQNMRDRIKRYIDSDLSELPENMNTEGERNIAVGRLRRLHIQSSLIPITELIMAKHRLVTVKDISHFERTMVGIMWDVQNVYLGRVETLVSRAHAILYDLDPEYRKIDNENFLNSKYIDEFSPDIRYLPLSNDLFDVSGTADLFEEVRSLAGKSEAVGGSPGVSIEGQPILPYDKYILSIPTSGGNKPTLPYDKYIPSNATASTNQDRHELSIPTFHSSKPLLNVKYLLFGDPDEMTRYGPNMDISALSSRKRRISYEVGLRRATMKLFEIGKIILDRGRKGADAIDERNNMTTAEIVKAEREYQILVKSHLDKVEGLKEYFKKRGKTVSKADKQSKIANLEERLLKIVEAKSYLDNLVKPNNFNTVLSSWRMKPGEGLFSSLTGVKEVPHSVTSGPFHGAFADKIKELMSIGDDTPDDVMFFDTVRNVKNVTLYDMVNRRVDILPMRSKYVDSKVNLDMASAVLNNTGAPSAIYTDKDGIRFGVENKNKHPNIYPISWIFSHMMVKIKSAYDELLSYIARSSRSTNDPTVVLTSLKDIMKFSRGFDVMISNSRSTLIKLNDSMKELFESNEKGSKSTAGVGMSALNRALSQLIADDQSFSIDVSELLTDMSKYDGEHVGIPGSVSDTIRLFYEGLHPDKSRELKAKLGEILEKLKNESNTVNEAGDPLPSDDLGSLDNDQLRIIDYVMKVMVMFNFANKMGAGAATLSDILTSIDNNMSKSVMDALLQNASGMDALNSSLNMINMLTGDGNFMGIIARLHSIISSKFDAMTVFIALYVTIGSTVAKREIEMKSGLSRYTSTTNVDPRSFVTHLLQIRNIVYEVFKYTSMVMGIVDFLKLKGKNFQDFLASVGYEHYVRSQFKTVTSGDGQIKMVAKSAYAKSSAYFSEYGGLKNADEFLASIASAKYSKVASAATMKGIKEALTSYTDVQLRPLMKLFDQKYGILMGSGLVRSSLSKGAKRLLTGWSANLTFLPKNSVLSRLMYDGYKKGQKSTTEIEGDIDHESITKYTRKKLYDFERGVSQMIKSEAGLDMGDPISGINTFLSRELIMDMKTEVRLQGLETEASARERKREMAREEKKKAREKKQERKRRGKRKITTETQDEPELAEKSGKSKKKSKKESKIRDAADIRFTTQKLINTALSAHKDIFRSTTAGWNRLTLALMERYTLMEIMNEMFERHDKHISKFMVDGKSTDHYIGLRSQAQKEMLLLKAKYIATNDRYKDKIKYVIDETFGVGNLSKLFTDDGTIKVEVYDEVMNNVRANLLKGGVASKNKITVADIFEIHKLEAIVKTLNTERLMYGVYVQFLNVTIDDTSFNSSLSKSRDENFRSKINRPLANDMVDRVSKRHYEASMRMMNQMRKLVEMGKAKWEFFRHSLNYFMERGITIINDSKKKFNTEVKKMSNFKRLVERRIAESANSLTEEKIAESIASLDKNMLSMEDHLEFAKVMLLFQFYGDLLTGNNEALVNTGKSATSDVKNALTMMNLSLVNLENRTEVLKREIRSGDIRSHDEIDASIYEIDLMNFLKVVGGSVVFDHKSASEVEGYGKVFSVPMVDLSTEKTWSNLHSADPYKYMLTALNTIDADSGYAQYMKSKYSLLFDQIKSDPIVRYYYYSKYMGLLDKIVLGVDMLMKVISITSNRDPNDTNNPGYFSVWKNLRNVVNGNVLGNIKKSLGPASSALRKVTGDWLVTPTFKLIKNYAPKGSYAWIIGVLGSDPRRRDVPPAVVQVQRSHGVLGVLTASGATMFFVLGALFSDQSHWFSSLATGAAAYVSNTSSSILTAYHTLSIFSSTLDHASDRQKLPSGLSNTYFNFWTSLFSKPDFLFSVKNLLFALKPALLQACGHFLGLMTGYPETALFLSMMADFALNVAHSESIRKKMKMSGRGGAPFMGVIMTSLGSSISSQADYYDVYKRMKLVPEEVTDLSEKRIKQEYENKESERLEMNEKIDRLYAKKLADYIKTCPARSKSGEDEMDICPVRDVLDISLGDPNIKSQYTVPDRVSKEKLYASAVMEITSDDPKYKQIYEDAIAADIATIRCAQGTEGTEYLIDENQARMALEEAVFEEIENEGTHGPLLTDLHREMLRRDTVTTIDRVRQFEYMNRDTKGKSSVVDFVNKIDENGAIRRRYPGDIRKQNAMKGIMIRFYDEMEKVDPTFSSRQTTRNPMDRDHTGSPYNPVERKREKDRVEILKLGTADFEYASSVGGAPPSLIRSAIDFTENLYENNEAANAIVSAEADGKPMVVTRGDTDDMIMNLRDEQVDSMGSVDLLQEIGSITVDYVKSDNVKFTKYTKDMVGFSKIDAALSKADDVYDDFKLSTKKQEEIDAVLGEREKIQRDNNFKGDTAGYIDQMILNGSRYVKVKEGLWVTDNYKLGDANKDVNNVRVRGIRYREPAYRNRKLQIWNEVSQSTYTDPISEMVGGYTPQYKVQSTNCPTEEITPNINVLDTKSIGLSTSRIALPDVSVLAGNNIGNIEYTGEYKRKVTLGGDDIEGEEVMGGPSAYVSEERTEKFGTIHDKVKIKSEMDELLDVAGENEDATLLSTESTFFGHMGEWIKSFVTGGISDIISFSSNKSAIMLVDKPGGDDLAPYERIRSRSLPDRTANFKFMVRNPSGVAAVVNREEYLNRLNTGSIDAKQRDVGMGHTIIPESNIYMGISKETYFKSKKSFPMNKGEAMLHSVASDVDAGYDDSLVSNHYDSDMMKYTMNHLLRRVHTINEETKVHVKIRDIANLYSGGSLGDDESSDETSVKVNQTNNNVTSSDERNADMNVIKTGYYDFSTDRLDDDDILGRPVPMDKPGSGDVLYAGGSGQIWIDLLYGNSNRKTGGRWDEYQYKGGVRYARQYVKKSKLDGIFETVVGDPLDVSGNENVISERFKRYLSGVSRSGGGKAFLDTMKNIREGDDRYEEYKDYERTYNIMKESLLTKLPDHRKGNPYSSNKDSLDYRVHNVGLHLSRIKHVKPMEGETPKDALFGFTRVDDLKEAMILWRNTLIPQTFKDKHDGLYINDIATKGASRLLFRGGSINTGGRASTSVVKTSGVGDSPSSSLPTGMDVPETPVRAPIGLKGDVKSLMGEQNIDKEVVMNAREEGAISFLNEAANSYKGRANIIGNLPNNVVSRVVISDKSAMVKANQPSSISLSRYSSRPPRTSDVLNTVARYSSNTARKVAPDGVMNSMFETSKNSLLSKDVTSIDYVHSVGKKMVMELLGNMSKNDKANILNTYIQTDIIDVDDNKLMKRYFGTSLSSETYFGKFANTVGPPLLRNMLSLSILFWDDMNRYDEKTNAMSYLVEKLTKDTVRELNIEVNKESRLIGGRSTVANRASGEEMGHSHYRVSSSKYFELLATRLTMKLNQMSYVASSKEGKINMIGRTKKTIFNALIDYSNVGHRTITRNSHVRKWANMSISASLLGAQLSSALFFGGKMRSTFEMVASRIGYKSTVQIAEIMMSTFMVGNDLDRSFSNFMLDASDSVGGLSLAINEGMTSFAGSVAEKVVQNTIGVVESGISGVVGYIGQTIWGSEAMSGSYWDNYISKYTGYAFKYASEGVTHGLLSVFQNIFKSTVSLFSDYLGRSTVRGLMMLGSVSGIILGGLLAAVLIEISIVIVMEILVYVVSFIPTKVTRYVLWSYLSLTTKWNNDVLEKERILRISKRVKTLIDFKRLSSRVTDAEVRNGVSENVKRLGPLVESLLKMHGLSDLGTLSENMNQIESLDLGINMRNVDVRELLEASKKMYDLYLTYETVSGSSNINPDTKLKLNGLSSGMESMERTLRTMKEHHFVKIFELLEKPYEIGRGIAIVKSAKQYGGGFLNWFIPTMAKLVIKLMIQGGIVAAIATVTTANASANVMRGLMKWAIVPSVYAASGRVLTITDIADSHMGWILLHKSFQKSIVSDTLFRWKKFIFYGVGVGIMFSAEHLLSAALVYFGMGSTADVLRECGLLTYINASGYMSKIYIGTWLGDVMEKLAGSILNVLFSSDVNYRETRLLEYMVNMGVDPVVARRMLSDPKSKDELRHGKLPRAMLSLGSSLPVNMNNIVSNPPNKIVKTMKGVAGYGIFTEDRVMLRPGSFMPRGAAQKKRRFSSKTAEFKNEFVHSELTPCRDHTVENRDMVYYDGDNYDYDNNGNGNANILELLKIPDDEDEHMFYYRDKYGHLLDSTGGVNYGGNEQKKTQQKSDEHK